MFLEIFLFKVFAFLVLWILQKPSYFPPGKYLCRLTKNCRITYLANQFLSVTFGQEFSYTLSLENAPPGWSKKNRRIWS